MSVADAAEIRLLVCGKCRTIEQLDDFQGPPEYDVVLAVAAGKHKDGTGIPHAPAQLLRVNEKDWNAPRVREAIEEKIRGILDPTGSTGFDAGAYAMVDNFRADAMACWGKHLRTPDCSDYKTPQMRIAPDTKTERKELGLNPRYDAQDPKLTKHLCDYCPVHSLVQQAARKKAGLYDK